MHWLRFWSAIAIGLAVMLVVRWVPLLSPLVVGILVGFFIRDALKGAVAAAITGILGNTVIVIATPYVLSQISVKIVGSGLVATTTGLYYSLLTNNPVLLIVGITAIMVAGGVIGGAISKSRLLEAYNRGFVKGEDIQNVKDKRVLSEKRSRKA